MGPGLAVRCNHLIDAAVARVCAAADFVARREALGAHQICGSSAPEEEQSRHRA